jgi:serine/threonine protein kinase
VCAGKKIHEVLLDPGNEGVRDITGRYVQECQLMSDLRHPNITQFLGVCFLPDCRLPVLLMERLDGSLDDLLETVPNIPLVLKLSVLEDVSRGLLYLHKYTPQIIHRDLTAKNVLLTSSFVAKITDFGNARIANLQPDQLARTMTRVPGTQAYMPPEALSANARYGSSLDIFSFGHLALFTINQVCLLPLFMLAIARLQRFSQAIP